MPSKSLHFCGYPGCNRLVTTAHCEEHQLLYDAKKREQFKRYDKARGTATERGYTSRWSKYSKWFLSQPNNQICKLHLPGCTIVAQCVDHIEPVNGAGDFKFWNTINHQPACIHCNSVKGHKNIVGEFDLMEEVKHEH